MQRRLHSLYEAVGNTAIGMVISYAAAWVVYPALGMGGDAVTYAAATAIFTLLSILRGYCVRRIGNWYQFRARPNRYEATNKVLNTGDTDE